MNIIFAGSSEFGLPALAMLAGKGYNLLVLSQPDKPAGRRLKPQPCPVAAFACQHGLDLFQPEDVNSPDSLERIRGFQPALIVTTSYGGLLKRELRKLPPKGAINLHPSLLPLYRGATPIQSCLLNGDERSGVTIFRLTAHMDAGPILGRVITPVGPNDNYSYLHDRLATIAANFLGELLPGILDGSIVATAQDETMATHTSKVEKADLLLDWSLPAQDIHNLIRAFSLTPGAFSFLRSKPLKILETQLANEPAQGSPGSISALVRNRGFMVNCRDRQLLVTQVQPAGKKPMSAWAYHLGARLKPGDSFTAEGPSNNQIPQREEQ